MIHLVPPEGLKLDMRFGEELQFYRDLALSVDGPLLELGVGSGRVAVPLAAARHEVVGIDTSPSMWKFAAPSLLPPRYNA